MWQKGGVHYGVGRKEMGHEVGRFERKEVWQERCFVEGMYAGTAGGRDGGFTKGSNAGEGGVAGGGCGIRGGCGRWDVCRSC